MDIAFENNYFIVNKFCRDYLASFLRTKIFYSRAKLVTRKSSFFVYDFNFKYQSIFDILFRFNVIFTLFLSKAFLPAGKFFFERSFQELTNNLAQLIVIYKFRNVAEGSVGTYLLNETLSLRLGKFLRKIGIYFVFFSQLSISRFFKCFFKFLLSAINRTFTGVADVSNKSAALNVLSAKSSLYAYKFKQLWQLSSLSKSKTLIVDNYRLGFETFLKKFASRAFAFKQNEQFEDKRGKGRGRFKKYRPYKVKSYLRLQPVGLRTYPVRLRYKYRPRFPVQFKLFAFKKQFLFLYFWSINFFSFLNIKNVNKKSF